jgi:hypothetical protein
MYRALKFADCPVSRAMRQLCIKSCANVIASSQAEISSIFHRSTKSSLVMVCLSSVWCITPRLDSIQSIRGYGYADILLWPGSVAKKRPPPKRRPSCIGSCFLYDWRNLRRAIPAKPRMPVPNRAMLEGSGTELTGSGMSVTTMIAGPAKL